MLRRLLSCSLLFAAVAVIAAQEEPVGICGVDGFDLTDLYFGQYWSFKAPDPGNDCLREIAVDEVKSCTIFFSVCKPLPAGICGDDYDNVSYCEVVVSNNDTTYKYSIGNYTQKHSFVALADGFQSIRYGPRYPDEQLCMNSTVITTTNFECDTNAIYDPSNSDITQYLSSINRLNGVECLTQITVKYSGACYQQPTLAPSHCMLTGFNTTAISEMDYFYASSSGACYDFDEGDDCFLLFAFCHPLPLDVSEHCRNPESAICQANKLEEATQSWSMGAYENYTRFYENVNTDEVGFHVTYMYGSNPGSPNCTNGITTRVIFVCNKNAQWVNRDVTFYIEVAKEDCYFNIVAQYSGACYKSHDINGSSSRVKTSFIGWIFIGIFMFAILSYLTIGTAVQYFVRHERGLRVIPNFDFWRNFVLLTMEGCKYTLDIITCNRFNGVPGKPKMNYDQL